MKSITIIFATLFVLQFNTIFANNSKEIRDINNSSSEVTLNFLSPSTPVEADFSDVVPEALNNLSTLAPVTPAQADFNETISFQMINLAPVTPAETDFNENDIFVSLVPVTPATADFE